MKVISMIDIILSLTVTTPQYLMNNSLQAMTTTILKILMIQSIFIGFNSIKLAQHAAFLAHQDNLN